MSTTTSGATSVKSGRRVALGIFSSAILLVIMAVSSLFAGSNNLDPATVVEALSNNADSEANSIVLSLRVPRLAAAALVGIGLGLAGVLIQALTRNPLADPGLLGVGAGSAFSVAIGIVVFGVASISGYLWWAFGGAALVTVAVVILGDIRRSDVGNERLILAGVAVGAVLGGLTTALSILNPSAFDQMRFWNAGSVTGRGWEEMQIAVIPIALGIFVALACARALDALALGDALAQSVGVHLNRARVLVVLGVTLLAGGATALAGPIGFVGLMVPYIARWIVGHNLRAIIALTLFIGPTLVITSDIIARVAAPGEVPVGIVTAVVGAPLLIILVRQRRVRTF